VLAISADRPSELVKSRERHDLGYQLFSDASLEAARAFGIVFQLDDDALARYAEFGIDLEAASGHDHHQLPVPSVFLVEAGGAIRWVHSDPDYKRRPDNASLLGAAREIRRDPGRRQDVE
jgi:peroxiredoxin